MRILVCEDDMMMSKAIEHKLLQEKYTVIVREDGRAATEAIRTQDFDLIITDLLMPFVNGLEIIRLVRSELGNSTPIIAFSKLGNEETILEALAAGANDYLAKPFKPNELVIRIKNQLHKKPLLTGQNPVSPFRQANTGSISSVPPWTTVLLKELSNQQCNLSEILLRAENLIREEKIRDEKFIAFISNEYNGYRWDETPAYRQVETKVFGNFFEARGFGILASKKDIEIPPDYFSLDLRDQIYTARITSPAGELESILQSGDEYLIPLPYFILSEVSKNLDSKWRIEGLWQKIDLLTVNRVLYTIRLGLAAEIARILEESVPALEEKRETVISNSPAVKQEKNINELLDASLNRVREKENQLFIKKRSAPLREAAVINENPATPPDKTREEIDRFISELMRNLDRIGLSDTQKQELSGEIQRLQGGMNDQKVKPQTISDALNSINSILHR